MSNEPGREGETSSVRETLQLAEEGYKLASAIRRELFGYLGKAVVAGIILFLGFVGTIMWAWFEYRLPKIAGGVPNKAVLIFNSLDCPDGWQPLAGKDGNGVEMRAIVVAAPRKEGDNNAHPRPLHFNETRGHFTEGGLVKAPSDVRQPGENEERVFVPGLLALTYCEKVHQ
jgi:hypothetical protein